MTRVCVPSAERGGLDDRVGEHFGRVPVYTIYDTEAKAVHVVENTSEHAGGAGLPGEILVGLGIGVLLCSGIGRRAIALLNERGIEVCSGFTGTVGQAISAWEKGDVLTATEADGCQQHAFHDRH